MWPTPTVQDSANNGGPSQFRRNSLPLNAVVKLWPTPTVSGNYNRAGSSAKAGDGLATAAGGALNPMWVEWLMGFPPGWTDCEPSETP